MSSNHDNIIKQFENYILSHPSEHTIRYPKMTASELQIIEQTLGFELPDLLRDIYMHIGRVCFENYWELLGWVNLDTRGYGVIDDYSIIHKYSWLRLKEVIPTKYDPLGEWPDKLIPFCTWGYDPLYYCVDCSQAPFAVFKYNSYTYEYDRLKPAFPSLSLWFEALFNNTTDLWYYNRKEMGLML